MSALSQQSYLTPDQYLQIEETGNTKHEYIDGQSYAMAGECDAHVTIAGNLFALLRSHVRGSDCRVYISDMKARIEALNRFYYPDVMVSCDSRDLATPNYKRFPTLIIEVLSDSAESFGCGSLLQTFGAGNRAPKVCAASPKPFQETEAFDPGDKFVDYQQIDSLREYVLISTKQQRIDCLQRTDQGLWLFQSYNKQCLSFRLDSVGFDVQLELLYEDVLLR